MDRSTMARTGIAGAVAGLGLAFGGIAMASADTETPNASTSQTQPEGRPDRGHAAETLATELGLDQDVVQKALDAVRDELRPEKTDDGTRPEPPTEAERAARQAAFVKALAEELDVSEAKVKAAVAVLEEEREAQQEERRTEARADLVDRLDAAIDDGTLTEADKTSVLKAFDAKVLGGGPDGGPGGGHGPGRPAA